MTNIRYTFAESKNGCDMKTIKPPSITENMSLSPSFGYLFPSIRGLQAGREYYISMCPLRLLPKMFLFDEEELVPELRAQRILNKARLPEMSRYVLENKANYVFSAITASIDGEVNFQPFSGTDNFGNKMGILQVSMDAKFIINDGQHRRAAIEIALKEDPDLGHETIAVVFFVDQGLERCQQMFADLNRYAIRPSKSLGVLYDHRDDMAQLVKTMVLKSTVFKGLVEMEKSTLSTRSRRLFTLSALYHATSDLLSNIEMSTFDEALNTATLYWETVGKQFPEWELVRENKLTAGEVRRDYIHTHGVVLHALGIAGNALLQNGDHWCEKLPALRRLDWSRTNSASWEGRAMVGGRVTKSSTNLTLTANFVKKKLGLKLSNEEQRIEKALLRGNDD